MKKSSTHFLNDQYLVVEVEEKSEVSGEVVNAFEVRMIKPEDDWFERKERAFCKQVLRENFVEKKTKVKVIGDFFVFVSEKENRVLYIQGFDVNGCKRFHKSEDLSLDADLYDVIASKNVTAKSFSFYLLDKELDVYVLSYSHEFGVNLKKLGLSKKDEEEEDEKGENNFQCQVRKYRYGTYTIVNEKAQRKTLEYLMVYKKKKFYLANFDTNELIYCGLPRDFDKDSEFFNWTIHGNYLYLLFDITIKIYQLNFKDHSGVLDKLERVDKIDFERSRARWILVNPCLTVLMSAGSLDGDLTGSVQLLIGSTQRLLIKTDWHEHKLHFDECRLDNMLEEISSLECKFEDERLLVQTNKRSYFRDFNVCERRVEKDKYGQKVQTKYDMDELSIISTESTKGNKARIID